ncbi:negative regulator of flagellin synthesis FlgM [Syntrophotalea carbinolica DSM 2380]|uniref:Negative regulator of flagellin synthesis n=1 Tax=Syntrophotalea carbinolica (strain DSM 2380 / NBRC 103641 / GraBd1) TaxID=338963 RepID=Q3A5F7_SYNC1|nr:flagellar biosynthesis anti-sigma factor FlgM [Syntrophotalea carbinolica]ABA88400.1 negative regulator of flagellin synthesis FlgM [Syntrophotalea carbinolica DSM 2380]
MTIKINGNGFNNIGPIDRVKKTDKAQKGDKAAQNSIDRVQFSSVIAETMRTRETSATSETARAEKLQSLKEQIADGSYSPDSTKVAASLLKFLAENPSK